MSKWFGKTGIVKILKVFGHILPYYDNKIDLGAPDKKFRKVYAHEFVGMGGGVGHERFHNVESPEDHNVLITNLQNKDVLTYDATTGKWKNIQLTQISGSGLIKMIYADETPNSGNENGAMKTAQPTIDTYERIICESEGYVEIQNNVATPQPTSFNVYFAYPAGFTSPIQKCRISISAGETFELIYAIKHSAPFNQVGQNPIISVVIELSPVAGINYTWYCNSLRLYVKI